MARPVELLDEAPRGWLEATLASGPADRCFERAWREATGLTAGDSRLVITAPIHNEQRSLSSFFGALMLAAIPGCASATLVLVTNACTDASVAIVQNFMRRVGPVVAVPPGSLGLDSGEITAAQEVRARGWRIVHVDVPTPSKAAALNLANRVALAVGDEIVISIDANNYPEPDAIATMFAAARRGLAERHDLLVLSGLRRAERKASPLNALLVRRGDARGGLAAELNDPSVNGWLMAWAPRRLERVGGFPTVAVEVEAIRFVAGLHGMTTARVPGVHVWGYVAQLFEEIPTRARVARGYFQLAARYPCLRGRLAREYYFLRDFQGRLRYCTDKIRRHPERSPRRLARYAVQRIGSSLIWEYCLWKARRDYERNPTNQSWSPIRSTK